MAMQFGEWRVRWLYDGDEADGVGGQGRTGCDACRYQAAAFGRSAVVVSRARPSAHTVIRENRQLAFGLQDRLACPVGQRLVSLPVGLAPPRRWGENGQERQRPVPARPADRHHHHQ